jgi:ribosomal protein L11 methylase PrmA
LQSVLIQAGPGRAEDLVAQLWELGTAGILEENNGMRAFFDDLSSILPALGSLDGLVLEMREEPEAITPSAPSHNSDPIYLGNRFFLLPPGTTSHQVPSDRTVLRIDANDAFGSGSHESTQLMATAMEQHLRRGATVLDVGCGSGVLSAAAQGLGAGRVIACDTHWGAVNATRTNAPDVMLFAGSADAVATAGADMVLANISARVIDLLAEELVRVIATEGLLLLSGFIAGHTPCRFAPVAISQQGDWLCWLCYADGLLPTPTPERPTLQPFSPQWW